MKKTIATVLLTLCAGYALAISDAEKTAFLNKISEEFIPAAAGKSYHEKLESTYQSMKAATDPVAAWALTEPAAYHAWSVTAAGANGGHIQWVVRSNILKANPAIAFTAVQDAAINDCANAYDKANSGAAQYAALKDASFEVGGIKMSMYKVMALAAKYGDIEAFESYSSEEIARTFDAYLGTLSASLADASPEAAWNKYVKVRKAFTSFKNQKNGDGSSKFPKVAENWARLLEDEDSAYVDYKRSK